MQLGWKKLLILGILNFSLFLGLGVNLLQAQIRTGLTEAVSGTEINTKNVSLTATIANVVRTILGFLGVISLLVVIYAGFLYTTSMGGDSIKKAQNILLYGVIGLVLIFGAYSFSSYVIRQLEEKTLNSSN